MKTKMKTQAEGILFVKSNTFTDEKLIFIPDTLVDWYPLNINYEYRYNKNKDVLYLVPTEKNITPFYGVYSIKDRHNSEVSAFSKENWFCREVSEDNEDVIRRAKWKGLKTLRDEYTESDVGGNIMLIAEFEHKFREKLKIRFDKRSGTREKAKYATADWEEKDVLLFKRATEIEKNTYILYGKFHVMTNLMRKMVNAGGVHGLSG